MMKHTQQSTRRLPSEDLLQQNSSIYKKLDKLLSVRVPYLLLTHVEMGQYWSTLPESIKEYYRQHPPKISYKTKPITKLYLKRGIKCLFFKGTPIFSERNKRAVERIYKQYENLCSL